MEATARHFGDKALNYAVEVESHKSGQVVLCANERPVDPHMLWTADALGEA